MKVCKKCNIEKSINEFPRDASKSGGYSYSCKNCKNKQNAAWYSSNKEEYNEKRKSESRRLHTSYLKRMSVKRKLEQDPLYIKKNNLKSQFSMTIDEYDELFKKCNNSCQICNIDADSHYKKEGRNLCIDHDHNTGKIRGLLCNQCNSALGKFKDSEELLLKAINYLKETL